MTADTPARSHSRLGLYLPLLVALGLLVAWTGWWFVLTQRIEREVLTRAEASLERSAQKVDLAAGTMDFAGLREELSALRQRVNSTPRFGALLLTGIVTAVLTVILTVIVLKSGVPGVLPPILPR